MAVGLAVVVLALGLAVLKPWGVASPPTIAVASPSVATPTVEAPSHEPEPTTPFVEPRPPTWADVAGVVSPHAEWGIRAIVSGPNPEKYAERWAPVDIGGAVDATTIVDPRSADVVALGITFPRTEAPLDVRIWLDHGDGDLEWIDARPVDDVPGRGAYLFLRWNEAQRVVAPWEPGRYQVDVLLGDRIRQFAAAILDPSGLAPTPSAPGREVPRQMALQAPGLLGLPVGLYSVSDGVSTHLPATAGPALDEAGTWLDVDPLATYVPNRSFVARAYEPRSTHLGVVLPPSSKIQSAVVHRLAPFATTTGVVGETTIVSGEAVSYVAFAPPGGGTWQPGVYALRVEWVDGAKAQDFTWHVELRPGPLAAEPILLSATRAWAHLVDANGVVLGWAGSFDGGSEAPESGVLPTGLRTSPTIGCGDFVIPAGVAVVGIVGPTDVDLAPVTSTILFPLADGGPLPLLTASGAVPGLAVVAPVLTAEFGGPAAYGFRAGSSPDAPGYTICVGLAPAR